MALLHLSYSGKFPFCLPAATDLWDGTGTPADGEVGPGTYYPVGVAEDDAMRWYWDVASWQVTCAIGFSGTRAAGAPTTFSWPFGSTGTVTTAAAQNDLVCATSVSGSDGTWSFRLWDGYPRAYLYGGLVYPFLNLVFQRSGIITINSYKPQPFPKTWPNAATVDGYSIPLWYDENGAYDSIDGVPGDNAGGNGYTQSLSGTGSATVATTF